MPQSEINLEGLEEWTRVSIHFLDDIVVHRYIAATGVDYDCLMETGMKIPLITYVWNDGEKLLFQYPDSADLLWMPRKGFEIQALYPVTYRKPPVLSSFRWYDC